MTTKFGCVPGAAILVFGVQRKAGEIRMSLSRDRVLLPRSSSLFNPISSKSAISTSLVCVIFFRSPSKCGFHFWNKCSLELSAKWDCDGMGICARFTVAKWLCTDFSFYLQRKLLAYYYPVNT